MRKRENTQSSERVRIFTRRGDDGTTESPGLGRVPKDHPRLDAIGTLDELNCVLGEIAALIESSPFGAVEIRTATRRIRRIQRDLFEVGSLVVGAPADLPDREAAKGRARVRRLERQIESMEKVLPECEGFILPGGHITAASAHVARAVCRRAERRFAAVLRDTRAAGVVLPYLNRLSDWLFVFARRLNILAGRGDEYWREFANDGTKRKRQ